MTTTVQAQELDEVINWRQEVLEHAGYDELHAIALAADTRVDLHKACKLVGSGCNEELAYHIMR